MQEFKKEIIENEDEISLNDMDRSARYAKDLVNGLATVRKFEQGVTIFGSARFAEDTKWYELAQELGAKLAAAGHAVVTGGGPGIMEAANRGAYGAGGRSVGMNIHLATEQDLNPYTTDSMEFHYFFSRKLMMTLSAKAYVFFPGGFGTMDEFSEILELKHTGKSVDTPIFLVGKEFWQGLDDWFAGPMSKWNLIETGKKGEMREIDFRENPAGEFLEKGEAPKLPRKLAADEQIHHAVENARDLYMITDNMDEIVAAVNGLDPKENSQKIADILRDDKRSFSRKK